MRRPCVGMRQQGGKVSPGDARIRGVTAPHRTCGGMRSQCGGMRFHAGMFFARTARVDVAHPGLRGPATPIALPEPVNRGPGLSRAPAGITRKSDVHVLPMVPGCAPGAGTSPDPIRAGKVGPWTSSSTFRPIRAAPPTSGSPKPSARASSRDASDRANGSPPPAPSPATSASPATPSSRPTNS